MKITDKHFDLTVSTTTKVETKNGTAIRVVPVVTVLQQFIPIAIEALEMVKSITKNFIVKIAVTITISALKFLQNG